MYTSWIFERPPSTMRAKAWGAGDIPWFQRSKQIIASRQLRHFYYMYIDQYYHSTTRICCIRQHDKNVVQFVLDGLALIKTKLHWLVNVKNY